MPAAALVRRAHALAVDSLASSPRTLHALGDAILQSELGASARRTAVDRFQRWIAGYREHAELLHGYGTSALSYSGPTPATRWAAQLDQLDAAARTAHARAFADLGRPQRDEIVREQLSGAQAQTLTAVGRAPHVALALLSHIFASADATDLCYGAHIGKQTCRPLAGSERRPLPLAAAHR